MKTDITEFTGEYRYERNRHRSQREIHADPEVRRKASEAQRRRYADPAQRDQKRAEAAGRIRVQGKFAPGKREQPAGGEAA
jgi:hypothetical protein